MTIDNGTTHKLPRSSIRALSEEECYQLLVTTTVGRVAFVNAGGQQLVPLNFAMIEGNIYFRTSPDSVLNDLAEGLDEVAFEVDYHAQTHRDGWDITIRGATSRVSDPELYDLVMSWARLRPWAAGTRAVVVQLVPRTIEGRQVSNHG